MIIAARRRDGFMGLCLMSSRMTSVRHIRRAASFWLSSKITLRSKVAFSAFSIFILMPHPKLMSDN